MFFFQKLPELFSLDIDITRSKQPSLMLRLALVLSLMLPWHNFLLASCRLEQFRTMMNISIYLTSAMWETASTSQQVIGYAGALFAGFIVLSSWPFLCTSDPCILDFERLFVYHSSLDQLCGTLRVGPSPARAVCVPVPTWPDDTRLVSEPP